MYQNLWAVAKTRFMEYLQLKNKWFGKEERFEIDALNSK